MEIENRPLTSPFALSGHERDRAPLHASGGQTCTRDGGGDDGGDLQLHGKSCQHGAATEDLSDGDR